MGKALYRKYRSKSLSEIVGQEHITSTLQNALKKGAISHAYLLTGPRGTGKTSIARILAHEVNDLPYSEEAATYLDIIEIDAASNNGVEHVRELRDKAFVTPSSAKYKVYIIDEVHMLSKQAFNALLKILEEPPAHVIFILATTEVHKLPETIISRTQRFTFKPVEQPAVIAHLRTIAADETIQISDDALQLIAAHGGGSFRDSISLLDQVSNASGEVSVEAVQRVLGIAPAAALEQLIAAISVGSTQAIAQTLSALRAQGYQASQLAKQLSGVFREQLISGASSLDRTVLTRALKQLLEVPTSHDAEVAFEITLIEIALQIDTSEPVVAARAVQPSLPADEVIKEVTPPAPKQEVSKPKPIKQADQPVTTPQEPVVIEEVISPPKAELQAFDASTWNQVLDAIKAHHNTLYGVARMAVPTVAGDNLTLNFKFAFHQKKINDTKPKQLIAKVIKEITGKDVTVSCVTDPKVTPLAATVTAPPKVTSKSIDTISNIFGGAEVLES